MRKSTFNKLLTTMIVVFFATGLQAQFVGPAPLIVPGDNYAFGYSSNGAASGLTPFGLYFNETGALPGFEFRGSGGAKLVNVQSIPSGNREPGDITFGSTGSLIVGPNRYAFRFSLTNNYGLFFNAADVQYEFRTADASPVLSIQADNGDVLADGDITAGGTITGEGSSSLGDFAMKGIGGNGPTHGYLAVNGSTDFDGEDSLDIIGTEIGVLGVSTGGSASDNSGVYGFSNGVAVRGVHEITGTEGRLGTSTYAVEAIGESRFSSGNVLVDEKLGVGTTNPLYPVHIEASTDDNRGLYLDQNYTGTSTKYGVYNVLDAGGTGLRYGIYNTVTANSSDNSSTYGMRSIVTGNGNAGTVYGVYSSVSSSGTGNRYAVFASASTIDPSPTAKSWALYASGNSYFSSDVRMGYTSDVPGYKLAVNGKIICEELLVQNSLDWPDYVFADDYQLMSLTDLEKSIQKNKHLPGLPSAAEAEKTGVSIGEMQKTLLEKVEELTLYMIDQSKEIEKLKLENQELKQLIIE